MTNIIHSVFVVRRILAYGNRKCGCVVFRAVLAAFEHCLDKNEVFF